MSNAINVIHPYKYEGQWVFDDTSKELDKEPFVAGADTLIDIVTDHAEKCHILFSQNKFPDALFRVDKVKEYGPEGGTDYVSQKFKHKLWLCPALLKYFDTFFGL